MCIHPRILNGSQSRDDAVDVRQSRDDDALRSDGFLVRGHDAREKVPGRVRRARAPLIKVIT